MSGADDVGERGASTPARLVAGLALIIAIGAAAVLLIGGPSGFNYRLVFEGGGQLVKGNQVSVAGQPIGAASEPPFLVAARGRGERSARVAPHSNRMRLQVAHGGSDSRV